MTTGIRTEWCATVEVNWAADGLFDGPYDDVTADTAAEPGLTVDMGRDGGRALNPPKVPAFDFELRNDTRKYSQHSPASPVYQLVTPGTPVRVTVTYGETDLYRGTDAYRADDPYRGVASWRLATGRIDEIAQRTAYGDQRVGVSVLGGSSALVGRQITIPLQTNIRTDEAIALVLDAADWPADARDLSLGDTTLLYWWVDERSAWEVLVELLASEGPGALYEDHEGVLHFEGRNYRAVTDRCQTAQAVFFDTGAAPSDAYRETDPYRSADLYRGSTSALYFDTFGYTPGWRNIYARSTYPINRRTLGALAPVWAYGGDLTLTAGQTLTLFARPSDPFENAVVPAITTDYTVTAGSLSSVSLTYTSGFLAIIVLVAGGSGATVRGPAASPAGGLQLRAQPLTVASQVIAQSTIDTSSSAATYLGIQTLSVSGWPEVALPTASAVCDAWVSRYNVERPQVTIGIRAGDRRHFEQVVARRVSDRIRVSERNSGIQADLWIESIQITMAGSGGRSVAAIWQCELCDEVSGYLWNDPESLWDLAEWGR